MAPRALLLLGGVRFRDEVATDAARPEPATRLPIAAPLQAGVEVIGRARPAAPRSRPRPRGRY